MSVVVDRSRSAELRDLEKVEFELSPSISSNITLLVFRARRVPLEAIGRYQPGDRQTDRQRVRQRDRKRGREREIGQ